jgi:hypothetical protein
MRGAEFQTPSKRLPRASHARAPGARLPPTRPLRINVRWRFARTGPRLLGVNPFVVKEPWDALFARFFRRLWKPLPGRAGVFAGFRMVDDAKTALAAADALAGGLSPEQTA